MQRDWLATVAIVAKLLFTKPGPYCTGGNHSGKVELEMPSYHVANSAFAID